MHPNSLPRLRHETKGTGSLGLQGIPRGVRMCRYQNPGGTGPAPVALPRLSLREGMKVRASAVVQESQAPSSGL